MDTSKLVEQLLPVVWVLWCLSAVVLGVDVVRRDLWPHPERRRAVAILFAVAIVAPAVTLFLPVRVDSSGLMQLCTGTETWIGASGKALVRALRVVWPLSHTDIIHVTRAWFVPTCLLVILSHQAPQRSKPEWTKAGIDLQLLLGAGVLLVTPSFLFGVLGVYSFWFVCSIELAMLLAWRELTCAPTWSARILLISSVVLVGFTRPELIVGGLVLAILAAVFAWGRRDWVLFVLAALTAVVLGAVTPTVLAYLGEQMRTQPLLTGADATGDAPAWWMMPWITIRRIAVHVPLNVLLLLIAFHGMGVLAVGRAVRMVRERRVSWPEVAAFALILTEFLAIGVHRAGFVRYVKYGQLLVVPTWFVASAACYALPPERKVRAWIIGSLVAGIMLSLGSASVSLLGYTRCSLPEGHTLAARMHDETLLWKTAPQWAQSLCGGKHEPLRVVVVGLDERVMRRSNATKEMFSKPSCEPERWPLVHALMRSGCMATAAYPIAQMPVDEALFDPEHGALCREVSFDDSGQHLALATHAIVTFYRPERLAEIRSAVGQQETCRWDVVEVAESAVLLRRAR